MTDADFLQEILAYPDDDVPRLVYADWLEERGDPRGQFIRVQCELNRLPSGSARYLELQKIEHKLLEEHEKEWRGAFSKWLHRWRRGFVDYLDISAQDFVEYSEGLLQAMPVRSVILKVGRWDLPGLAACPQLARLRELIFHAKVLGAWVGDDGIADLVTSPYLGSLQALSFYDLGIGPAGLAALARAEILGQLTSLHVSTNRLTGGLDKLAASPLIGRLTSLTLQYAQLNAEDVQHLAHARPRRLQSLCLSNNSIGAAGAQILAGSPLLAGLAQLTLEGCNLQDDGAYALAESPHANSLVALHLQLNEISDVGLALLAESTCLGQLTELDLSFNFVGDEGIEALARSPLLGRLAHLWLYKNRIGPRGIEALISSPYWTGKTKLDLRYNRLAQEVITDLQDRFGETFGELHVGPRPSHPTEP